MTPNISEINSKLKSREKRTSQSVSRVQIESAKLAKQVSKLTEKVDQLKADLKKAKAVSASLLPAKPAAKKIQASQQELEQRFQEQERIRLVKR